MTPQERLERHVERLNDGVRTGRFDDYGALFADDATLKLLGTGESPATRAHGPGDIADACARVSGGRGMRIVTVIDAGPESATCDYAWDSSPADVAGQMILRWRAGQVTCLTLTL